MTTTETITDRLSEIKARAEKATPGPWEPLVESCDCGGEYGCGHGSWVYGFKLPEAHNKHYVADPQYFNYEYSDIAEFSEADQALLLRALDDVSWLVAEVEQAREEIAKLQHALSVAEPHEADVRLEVEREVRAEFAEKAGA